MLFFRKEKAKPKTVKLKHTELNEQYQNLLGDFLNDFEAEVSVLFREINDYKQEIRSLLNELKEAELKNKNIPPKEKHFMEGNRLSYIKSVNDFISKLEEPDEISSENVREFLRSYEELSNSFKKASFRPGQITSQFFGDLLKRINENLKKINTNQEKMEGVMKSDNVKLLSSMRKKIALLEKEIERNEKLISDIEEAEKNYEALKEERAVFEERIRKIENNSVFLDLNEMKSKLKSKEEELKMLDASFIDSFLQIEKALKKFSNISEDEQFINKYIEDPVNAAINDSQLRIADILLKTGQSLQSGALEIDDKKKDKLLEKLAALDKQTFTNFIVTHNDLTLQISNLNRKINQNNSQRDLDDTKYKLEHVQQKQENAGDNIKKLNKQAEELEIEELKKEVEEGFERLNTPVEIEI